MVLAFSQQLATSLSVSITPIYVYETHGLWNLHRRESSMLRD